MGNMDGGLGHVEAAEAGQPAASAASATSVAWEALAGAVDAWLAERPVLDRADLRAKARETAVIIVDMVLGFARSGPLASPRVDALTKPIARFLTVLQAAGVRSAYRLEDAHTERAGEFAVYPAHCLEGTIEADPIPELLGVPLFRNATRIPKNALSVQDRLDLEGVLFGLGIRQVILVGDCTDLCIAANALPLRFAANAREHDLTVVVPMDLVDTFDAPWHPAEAMHRVALYHMGLNGIDVVRSDPGHHRSGTTPGEPAR